MAWLTTLADVPRAEREARADGGINSNATDYTAEGSVNVESSTSAVERVAMIIRRLAEATPARVARLRAWLTVMAVLGIGVGASIGASANVGAASGQQSSAQPTPETAPAGQGQPAGTATRTPPPAQGGRLRFTEPDPMDFNDHEGYVSLFDGVSLKGWDGNPKFWRVEDGAIVGESTAQNPSGNSYLVYHGTEAKDFTMKLRIKVEGSGGSGIQYRSKTGVPWLANISPNVTANVGPVNLNWMLTGPQADFWPSSPVWTGQFYSENTPMRILAWRGQVVEGFGAARKRLMGTIGDRQALGGFVKMNEWNDYTIIARGGVFLHILNGQLMAVMIDDDPTSSNNQSGLIGIEIEATTKVAVRDIWLKKLN